MTRLRIVTANVDRKNPTLHATVAALEDTEADVIGTQEAWRISSLMGYHRFRCDAIAGPNGTEVALFLNRDLRYLGHGAYQGSRDTGRPIGHDRWIVWARFAKNGARFCAIGTHNNAEQQELPSGALVDGEHVDAAADLMHRLLLECRRQAKAGFVPIVTMDGNYARRREQTGRLWRWSPHRALSRAGLRYYPHGLDGIAVPETAEVLDRRPFILPGSPHAGLQLDVEITGGRPRN